MPGRLTFVTAALFCLTVWASPGVALALGMGLALTLGNPYLALSRRWSKPLLQASVVLLGFGMNLGDLLRAGAHGLAMALVTIATAFALGALLARWLAVPTRVATLIAAGTAICGGSAIAAVSVVVEAAEAEMSVAIGAVFLLNAVALFTFPRLGHWLALSQVQFGTWAGMAIHDISSVVGAASVYGRTALETATAVKLARTLWIVPVALAAGWLFQGQVGAERKSGRLTIPWFIAGFLLASLARTLIPAMVVAAPSLIHASVVGMTLTLFLIGASLSRATLRQVGGRPLLLALLLWLTIGAGSLAAIRWLA